MRLIIDKSYIKDVRHFNHTTQIQAAEALESILDAQTFSDIPHLKPLKGQLRHYRIRFGDYRIGLYWNGETFFAQRIGRRGDFYKTYPPK
jgi:mRNA interferase RelE/StbE